jgi:tight adherence protein C
MEPIILVLVFVSVTLLVNLLFPEEVLVRKKEEEGEVKAGFLYQLKPLLVWISKPIGRLGITGFKKGIQKKMVSTGDPIHVSVDEFLSFCLLSGLLGFIVFLIFFDTYGMAFFGALLGFALPNIWLSDLVKKRKLSIIRQLPDFLDILTLAVEAGLDFGAAVQKVIGISKTTPMVQEFRFMTQEMKLGTTRYDALKNLATRIDIPEVSAFISSLLQADQMGSSLGPTLRIQADQLRVQRMQRAEKAGGEAVVKMLVPLMLFIFPAVFIVLFGPIIIRFLMKGF